MTLDAFLFWVIALSTGLCAIATVVTQNIVRAATWLLFTLAGTSGIFFLLGADLVGAVQLLVYVGGTLVLVVFGVMLTAQGPFINMKSTGAEWAISTVVGICLMGVLAFTVLAVRNTSGQRYTLSEEYRLGEPVEAKGKRKPRDQALAKYAPRTRLINATPEADKIRDEYGPKIAAAATPDERQDLIAQLNKDLEKQKASTSPYTNLIGLGLLGKPVGPAHTEKSDGKAKPVRANYLFPFEIVSVHLLVVLIGAAYLARAKRKKTQTPLIAGGPDTEVAEGGAP
ncbi:MAG: NADH-quinone oxidoreductase subunit J [Gemmataceae bacterium]